MSAHKIIGIASVLTLTSLLNGCAPVAVFGGATTVGTSIAEERGVGGVLSDVAIRAQVNTAWFDYDPVINEMVEIQVREGRILLTGDVDTPQRQIDAVRLTWSVEGVKEVIDETKIRDSGGFSGYTGDAWVTTKLKAELLFEPEILSVNYNIKTVDKVVYLIGIAQTQEELDMVIDAARNISGVEEVVSHVRLKDEPFMPGSPDQTVVASQTASSAMPTQQSVGVETLPGSSSAETSFPAPRAQ